jgi:O-antigen/teichoic acid export membrane protein
MTEESPVERRPVRGLHAGALVLMGVFALNAGNYLFHLIAARHLGPARYGDLATLVAISGLISLPLGGVQVWVARSVAQYRAVGDEEAIRWFTRRVGRYLAVVATAGTLALLALTPAIQSVLGIASVAAVMITALTAFPAIVSSVSWGLAQGLERFGLVSLTYAAGPVARIGLTLLAFAVGLQVGGAMLATLLSMCVGLLLPLWALRGWLGPAPEAGRRINRGEAVRSLLPVIIGLLAITALTSDDVVVAKAALSEHAAGIYGSASLIGRVVLYLPAAIITVLLPRVAARTADQRGSADLLAKSAIVTAAFCTVLTGIYAAGGSTIVRLAFGSSYADAGPLLWRFGIAMSLYAILNVLLVYHLGRGEHHLAWLLGVGAVLQLGAFAAVHGSAQQLVNIDIAFAAGLLAVYALLVGLGRR